MASRDELRSIVRELLAEMMAPLLGIPQEPTGNDWRDLSDAWGPLGYPSYHALYGAIQAGVFRRGKEVRDRRKSGAKQAQWQINLVAAQRRLLEDHSTRRSV
jgi:hypothetical protein